MNVIKIAMKCCVEHRAAIYTTITSMMHNKNKESKYDIYLLLQSDCKDAFQAIIELADEYTNFTFIEGKVDALKNMGKLIILSWNTIVQGDFNSLYNLPLEDKYMAAVENISEIEDTITAKYCSYNPALLLIDTNQTSLTDIDPDKIKCLPFYYNLSYEKLLRNKYKIDSFLLKETAEECLKNEELALLLSYDRNHSPEYYFDSEIEYLWIKYYAQSPIAGEILNRKSFIDNVDSENASDPEAVPILIRVNNQTAYQVSVLIDSIKKHMNISVKIDIRLIYDQLSQRHIRILQAAQNERISVRFYCVQKDTCDELFTAAVFAGRDKAISIYPKSLIEFDISKLYAEDLDGELICSGIMSDDRRQLLENGAYSNLFKNMHLLDMGISVINVKQWNRMDMELKIRKAMTRYETEQLSLHEVLNLICIKSRKFMAESYEIVFDYSEPERYKDLLESYISQSDFREELEADYKLYSMKEEDEMKDTLSRMGDLEKDNLLLLQECDSLKQKNKLLKKDVDRYLYEITETRKSISFKVGRFFTFIPRLIRKR